MASVAPLFATTCLALASYTFKDLGVEHGGRLTFDAQGNVNSTPVNPTAYTRNRDGSYSISYQFTGYNNDIRISTAVEDGRTPVLIGGLAGPTYAFSVNHLGTFVGVSTIHDAYSYGAAFSFTLADGTQLVPTPYAAPSTAFGINEAGLIVGSVFGYQDSLFPGRGRAFLSDGVSSWDLNTLIAPGGEFLLTSAMDINDLGQILGEALDTRDGTSHFFLLTPSAVPEPSSILMISLGMAALGLRRRMGRKSA